MRAVVSQLGEVCEFAGVMDVHVACSLADRAPRGEEPINQLSGTRDWDGTRICWSEPPGAR